MGFLDRHFQEVWISLVVCVCSLCYLALVFLQSPTSFTAEDALRTIPWVLYGGLSVAVLSASVTPVLYVVDRVKSRRPKLHRSVIETFE